MKEYERIGVQLHPFLTSALDSDVCSASHSFHFIPGQVLAMQFGWLAGWEPGACSTLWEEKIPVRIDQIGIYIILAARRGWGEGDGGGQCPVAGSSELFQKPRCYLTGGRFRFRLKKVQFLKKESGCCKCFAGCLVYIQRVRDYCGAEKDDRKCRNHGHRRLFACRTSIWFQEFMKYEQQNIQQEYKPKKCV